MSERPIPELREWFENADKQEHAARLGMWLFLTSEVLLFAGLFGLYSAYRVAHPDDFAAAARHNHTVIGTVNTVVLITSSFAVAWAVQSVAAGRRRMATVCFAATIALGAVFLLFKGIEYRSHVHEGLLPGIHYASEVLPSRGARLFFTLYWFMTALHGLHVVGGMVALGVVAVLTWIGKTRPAYFTPVENVGLYWHLVDVIWIFLWPLLYLVG
jgi:cytochrome c oxidase subunit III